MKLKDKAGRVLETTNPFVIEQLLKHGAVEIKTDSKRPTAKSKNTHKGEK